MAKKPSLASLADAYVKELARIDFSHEQQPTSEKLPALVHQLHEVGLLAKAGDPRAGLYVLRDQGHGSPVLLHNGFEPKFKSLPFTRHIRVACAKYYGQDKHVHILQIIE